MNDGRLSLGETVQLALTFNRVVSVTGTPKINLNNGGTAAYVSGDGTNTLTFSYTPTIGQSVSDLATATLAALDGTIKDADGHSVLELSFNNLNPAGKLEVDDVAPTVTSIAYGQNDGALFIGEPVTLTVTFSEAVLVDGTPKLALNNGGMANYSSGSGQNTLTFTYTPTSGQSTADLAMAASYVLRGAIRDAAGNSVIYSNFDNVNPAGTLVVDADAPTVTSIAYGSNDGALSPGETVTLAVTFSETVNVGSTPTIALNSGGTATYESGAGTNLLTFSYRPGTGQSAADLATAATNALSGVRTGLIRDLAGNKAVVASFNNVNPDGTLVVDTTAPTVRSIVQGSNDGRLSLGEAVTLTTTFSEIVTVTGTPTLALNAGGTAAYVSGDGTKSLIFSYTPSAGQSTADLMTAATNALTGTIKDLAGNSVVASGFNNLNPAETLAVDTADATVVSIAYGSSDRALTLGETTTLVVTLSEAVTVFGTPTIALNNGGTASFTGGSGSKKLSFDYSPQAGQSIADLATATTDALKGTITDLAGNPLTATGFNNVNPTGTLLVDATAPTVTSIVYDANDGKLSLGETMMLSVTFSEAVTGTPRIALNNGATATYAGGSGSNKFTFSYSPDAGQSVTDLATAATDALIGAIRDLNGNMLAPAGFNDVNPAGTLLVDTAAPTVSAIAYGTNDGGLSLGETVTLSVTFSEAVNVTGKPTIALNTGGTATYVSGSGTDSLDFSYTVTGSQAAADLATTGLKGVIKDFAGNTVDAAGFKNLNPTGTLAVDAVAPTVTSMAYGLNDGGLSLGETVTLAVSFDKAVKVTGTPTIALNSGGVAEYSGGSDTNSLTFRYTTAAGQSSGDLATAANALFGAITDLFGNPLSASRLDNINPAGTLAVDTTAARVISIGYTSGAGTNRLTFSYTPAAGQSTADLATATSNALNGTIRDLAGNAIDAASFNNVNPAGALPVDATAPAVTSIAYGLNDGKLSSGETVTLTITMSEAVTVAGTPTLALANGGIASYASGSGGNTLTFSYGPNDGSLTLGDTVTLAVTLSKAVNVTGTPAIALNNGGTAFYESGSGTNSLTFRYTVAAGQSKKDLATAASNALSGTIEDLAGNPVVATGFDNVNPAGIVTVDDVRPVVSSIAYGLNDGDLSLGEDVTLTVLLSEYVKVTGTPTIALNNGATAVYVSGSGSNTLEFRYTPDETGQSIADLGTAATNALSGTIEDFAGNPVVVTGFDNVNPAGLLAVDDVMPTLRSIDYGSNDGALILGETGTLVVTFSESVLVDGTPTVALANRGTAVYTSGSGTSSLIFSYTPEPGQSTADLATAETNALIGRITDLAGNLIDAASFDNVNPFGPLPVDASAPAVRSIAYGSNDGMLVLGETVTLDVTFTEVVTVSGTPTLALNNGGVAFYVGGSGTNSLTFSYTPGRGQSTPDLALAADDALSGVITDLAGNAVVASGFNAVNPAGALLVDDIGPAVRSIAYGSNDGALSLGETVTLVVTLSEAVSVTGTPTLALNNGGVATYEIGSGTDTLTFSYTPPAGQSTEDLTTAATNALGGTIKDYAGNAVDAASFDNVDPAGNLPVDSVNPVSAAGFNNVKPAGTSPVDVIAPTVRSIVYGTNDGVLARGETVTLTATFSEAVSVTGTPTISLNTGTAVYVNGSGTKNLTFSYTPDAGQSTEVLTTIALVGVIRDLSGNLLEVDGLADVTPAESLRVDTVIPAVSQNSFAYGSNDGRLSLGESVTLVVTFNEAVEVTGTPTIALNTGGTAAYANGSGTKTLSFDYTPAAGESTTDLATAAIDALSGMIHDIAGNPVAVAGFNNANPAGTLRVDAIAPTVSSIAYGNHDSGLSPGETVTLVVTFSEAVSVDDTPTLALANGGLATYSGGSGNNNLTFSYTVQAGQSTADLATAGVDALTGKITDLAGNSIVAAGFDNVNPDGTLGVDDLQPTVISISYGANDGNLSVGETVTLLVTFSEAVSVTDTPSIALANGGTATYTSGSGTNILNFSYTPSTGQSTADLATAANNALSGTIRDIAGNSINAAGFDNVNPDGALSVYAGPPGMTSFAFGPNDGALSLGETITLVVTFSDIVNVTGTPTITLNKSSTTKATYTSGSGTNSLTFSYTPALAQNTPSLSTATTNALSGAAVGTIKDRAGNSVDASAFNGVTPVGGPVAVDVAAPVVSSIAYEANDGKLSLGETLTLKVTFGEAVKVVGTPTIALSDGGKAAYTSGSGTNSLFFSYTPAAGEATSRLAPVASALGGVITDLAGNPVAATALDGKTLSGTVPLVDTTFPVVSSIAYGPNDGFLSLGEKTTFLVTFSENVKVTGTPTIALSNGGTATYTSGSDTATLSFSYTPGAGQSTLDLATVESTAFIGTVKDLAGNAIDPASFDNVNPAGTLRVYVDPPKLTSITYGVNDGRLSLGEQVTLVVTFSEAVIGSPPSIALNNGGVAYYQGGSGSDNLTFSYTPEAGQSTASLATAATNALSGTIKGLLSASPLDTSVLDNVMPAGALLVDVMAPTVASITYGSNDGKLSLGESVRLSVTFSEAVNVTGTAMIALANGGVAFYESGSGTDSLIFGYKPEAPHATADLVVASLNGVINDLAGNAMDASGAINANPVGILLVDPDAPTVRSAAYGPNDGSLSAGETVTLAFGLSEVVSVIGTPTIVLNNGGLATYMSGSGTSSLAFSYTAEPGQSTEWLATAAANALRGTINDLAGNPVNAFGFNDLYPVGALLVDAAAPG